MEGSNFSVWPLVVLMSVLLKNGDAFTIVQHKYSFTKMDVRLDCPFLEGPSIVWKETDVGEIAINGTITSKNAKYSNFDVSSERNISTLTINRAEMEDEGIYSCHSLTGNSISFQLHMQNPPTLSISVNGILVNTSIDLDENTEVTVECNSTGADPPVYVSLAVDDEPLTLDEQIINNYTQTAYASSRLTVERTHREIVCIDSEQKLPMYKKTIYLNVNYKELSVGAIAGIAIGVVVLLVGYIGLIIFKHKELSVGAIAGIAIDVVLLAGFIVLIIFKHKEWPVFLMALIAGVGGLLVGRIPLITIKYKELLVYAIVVNAIGVVVLLAGFIGLTVFNDKEWLVYAMVVNAYVVGLLTGSLRLLTIMHEELLFGTLVGIVFGVVAFLAGMIGSFFFNDTGWLVYAIVVIAYVVVLLVGFIRVIIIKRLGRENKDDSEPEELQPM